MENETKAELTRFIDGLDVVSTHEHHEADDFHAGLSLEKLLGTSYVGWCGIPTGLTAAEHTRFLEQVRYNTYFVWLEKSLQWLYDFEGPLTAENWEEISAKIAGAHRDPEWHLRILRQYCRYRADVQDTYSSPGSDRGHPDIFRPTYRINMFLFGYHESARDHNGNNPLALYGKRPRTFRDYLDFVEERIVTAQRSGCVALKSALAYDRTISFGLPAESEAASAYGKAPVELSPTQKTAFEDFVFDHVLHVAAGLGLPVQVHTGLGLIGGSNPMNFIGTIERHPEVRFDLFHGGYPWVSEVAGIAHNYSNVWLDLCWLPLISTSAAKRALAEWIDVAPSCERILWGADTWTGEESFGAVLAVRHVLATVLAERVDSGLIDLVGARDLARKILCDNARSFFAL